MLRTCCSEFLLVARRSILSLGLFGWALCLGQEQASVVQISGGAEHAVLLASDGSLWAMGDDAWGQLGDGGDGEQVSPVKSLSGGVKRVEAGGRHTLMIRDDGSLWAVGYNSNGQLGTGSTSTSSSWVKVLDGEVIAVSASASHTIALKGDGSVWTSGYNRYGQLGDGSKTDRATFAKVVESGVVAVAAGGQHSLALRADGSVLATGMNAYGQLGDGTKTDRTLFAANGVADVSSIGAGFYHSLFVKSDGSLWTAGENGDGQLGDGTRGDRSVPVKVVESGVVSAAGGFAHTLFLGSDGSAWGMGSNEFGQLGSKDAADRLAPTRIYSLGTTQVEAGRNFSLFLRRDGSLWGTGYNLDGQLGDGTKTSRWIPAQIVGPTVSAPNASVDFAGWLAANFSAEEIETLPHLGPDEDFDADGLTNAEEKRLGLDPRDPRSRLDLWIANRPVEMTLVLEGAHPYFEYTLLASADLQSWQAVAALRPGSNGAALATVEPKQASTFYAVQAADPPIEAPNGAPTHAEFLAFVLGRDILPQAYRIQSAERFKRVEKAGNWTYARIDETRCRLVFTFDENDNKGELYREEVELTFAAPLSGSMTYRVFEGGIETVASSGDFEL